MSTADKPFDLKERDSRTLEYAGWTLDPRQTISLVGDAAFLESIPGQHAAATAVNLLARMTPALRIQVPPVPNRISHLVPGATLREGLISFANAIAPGGQYDSTTATGAFRLALGAVDADMAVTGNAWHGAFGKAPRPFDVSGAKAGFGASSAACGAAAHIFRTQVGSCSAERYINLVARSVSERPGGAATLEVPEKLGRVWIPGCGSIGSSALFFLGLNPAYADLTLIDGDVVKTHNLDRGACFLADQVGDNKTAACAKTLARCLHLTVTTDPHYLHETELWRSRKLGQPDALISAANEYEVRSMIENGLPPLQIYATTGRSWQLSVWAHVPLKTPCSCCAFPPGAVKAHTACAKGSAAGSVPGPANDASLPFLSFLGGLLTAFELYRASTSDLVSRYDVWTRNDFDFVALRPSPRPECHCRRRDAQTYRKVLADSRYAMLSS